MEEDETPLPEEKNEEEAQEEGAKEEEGVEQEAQWYIIKGNTINI